MDRQIIFRLLGADVHKADREAVDGIFDALRCDGLRFDHGYRLSDGWRRHRIGIPGTVRTEPMPCRGLWSGAAVSERSVEAGTDEDGQPILVAIPGEQIHDIVQTDAPAGSTWTKTGTRPVYQGIDPSKMVADLTAGIQALTLLALQVQACIKALEAAASNRRRPERRAV